MNKMIKKNLELTLRLNEKGKITVYCYLPESGDIVAYYFNYKVGEHPEFYKKIGDEVYSWIELMADEMEEESDVIMG